MLHSAVNNHQHLGMGFWQMNTTNIKDIKINFNNGSWDPRQQSIVLSYDPDSKMGFRVKLVPVYQEEKTINDTEQAKQVLRKFQHDGKD
jgi:hypothetical protein